MNLCELAQRIEAELQTHRISVWRRTVWCEEGEVGGINEEKCDGFITNEDLSETN